jgi:F-type H+-transporting ATPase subunit gamma
VATLQQIKRRINSVKGTQKITKAMKMVAAARLRKAQEKIVNARPYAYKLREVLADVAARVDRNMHPLLEERKPEKVVYVVVTADRGLCGGFNTNILRKAETVLKAADPDSYSVICVGRKGYAHLKRRNYPIIDNFINFFNNLEYAHAQQITDRVVDLYLEKQFDRVILIYNEFKSAIQQNIITEQILPVVADAELAQKYESNIDYIYEPEPLRILDTIVPLNIGIQMWRVLLESNAAEQGARMTAMESATNNASDMIDSLTLLYNRLRQAAITKEISEIVGGAEALK